MLLERVESTGLAHYSYIIGDGREAVVIDPRRDCGVYIELAMREGLRITTILETHRNEDYVVGSCALAARTGAMIWHADGQLDYKYGEPVEPGQEWRIGQLRLRALDTPGHTLGSVSYLLHDQDGVPWIVFTGDTLFAGDVGRVDLVDVTRTDEMADHLYDSIFGTLLPLGDEIIVCPGHGSGSVCGMAIAERAWTTIGLERRHNPRLQHTTRDDFVASVAHVHERPPYFRRMEALNLSGADVPASFPYARPMGPDEFENVSEQAIILDTRMELGYSAAHVPGAVSIWLGGLSRFVGWFVPYDQQIKLVNENEGSDATVRQLLRLGYDDVAGILSGGMLAWHNSGRISQSISTITVQRLCYLLDERANAWILDVRSDSELAGQGEIGGAYHIHLTQLVERMDEVPRDRPVMVFCGSGLRSMIAASLLQRQGWDDVTVVLGGLAGWSSITCPLR